MNKRVQFLILWLTAAPLLGFAQDANAAAGSHRANEPASSKMEHRVIITGARFCYPLIEAWINEYKIINPGVEILIAPRALTDPLKYDVLAEVYEQDDAVRSMRVYLNIGRYAILPVTTTGSPLAVAFAETGLGSDIIKQIFFSDIFTAEKHRKLNGISFTVYTRLQKAGVPKVFSNHFGYEQKDLKGTAIAGADTHLLEAMASDSTGVTYLPLPLIYSLATRKPVNAITVLPPDINGNKRISDEEKFYDNLDHVIERLEREDSRNIKNIPLASFHLSVDKEHASPEAIEFVNWVNEHGRRHLHQFGFLAPEQKDLNAAFREFAAKQNRLRQ